MAGLWGWGASCLTCKSEENSNLRIYAYHSPTTKNVKLKVWQRTREDANSHGSLDIDRVDAVELDETCDFRVLLKSNKSALRTEPKPCLFMCATVVVTFLCAADRHRFVQEDILCKCVNGSLLKDGATLIDKRSGSRWAFSLPLKSWVRAANLIRLTDLPASSSESAPPRNEGPSDASGKRKRVEPLDFNSNTQLDKLTLVESCVAKDGEIKNLRKRLRQIHDCSRPESHSN